VQKQLANLKSLLAAAIDGSASKLQQSELVHHSHLTNTASANTTQ
jgi:hypothetical protein